jgi:hypothetical protein
MMEPHITGCGVVDIFEAYLDFILEQIEKCRRNLVKISRLPWFLASYALFLCNEIFPKSCAALMLWSPGIGRFSFILSSNVLNLNCRIGKVQPV